MRTAIAMTLLALVVLFASLEQPRPEPVGALVSDEPVASGSATLAPLGEAPDAERRSRPEVRTAPEREPAPAPRPHVVVIRPVDRSGAPLAIDPDRTSGGEVPRRLELELWTLDGTRKMDDRYYTGGPVTLEFDRGHREGFVTIAERWRSSGEQLRWLIVPDQPSVRRDVIGDWRGIEVKGGDPEVVFALGGEVRGRVERGDELDGRALSIRVRPAGTTGPVPWNVNEVGPVALAPVDADGAFHLRDVDAGPCRVEVIAGGVPLAVLEDVEVHLGEVSRDPRLASIALDVEVIELTVVDPAGDRVPDAFALLASGGHVERQDAGEASLAVLAPREPAPGAFLAVGAPGWVPRRLEPPFKSRTVVLEAALEIAPSPAARFEADTGAYGYWLRLRRTDAPTGLEQLDAVELDFAWASGDPRTIALPGPGRYELDVLVRMRMGSRFGYSPHDRWQRTGVLVDVSRADGPFTLELPDDIEMYSKTK